MQTEHTDDTTLPIPEAVRELVNMLQTSGTVSGDRIYFPERRTRELLSVVRAALASAQQEGQAVACRWPSCECPNGTAECPKRTKADTAPLQAEIEALRELCGMAYQLAGVHDAPEEWLDALSNAAAGRSFSTDGLLPYIPQASD